MKLTRENKYNSYFMCIAAILLLNSCKGHNDNESCLLHFKNAKRLISKYYINNDIGALNASIPELSRSLKCDITRKAAIERKISVLILLKQYREGIIFIDSLNREDLDAAYKKDMWKYYFLSLSDTSNKRVYLQKATKEITKYIDDKNANGSDKINQEAYYDLFFIKSFYEPKQNISEEISKLKITYPGNDRFFDALKEIQSSVLDKSTDAIPNG